MLRSAEKPLPSPRSVSPLKSMDRAADASADERRHAVPSAEIDIAIRQENSGGDIGRIGILAEVRRAKSRIGIHRPVGGRGAIFGRGIESNPIIDLITDTDSGYRRIANVGFDTCHQWRTATCRIERVQGRASARKLTDADADIAAKIPAAEGDRLGRRRRRGRQKIGRLRKTGRSRAGSPATHSWCLRRRQSSSLSAVAARHLDDSLGFPRRSVSCSSLWICSWSAAARAAPMVGGRGLEPLTSCMSSMRSNQAVANRPGAGRIITHRSGTPRLGRSRARRSRVCDSSAPHPWSAAPEWRLPTARAGRCM